MSKMEWLTVAAIVLGPIFAIQLQKLLERWKEKRSRKLDVFKTLMATRGVPLCWEHVQALNRIDLEFSGRGKRERSVQEAWKALLDHLESCPRSPEDPDYRSALNAWSDKANDMRADLLYQMSIAVGYSFDRVHLRKGVYSPRGHAEIEFDQDFIRRSLVDLFMGKKSLPVCIVEASSPKE